MADTGETTAESPEEMLKWIEANHGIEAFCVEMESRQYGREETADAFLWFERGWQRAQSRLD